MPGDTTLNLTGTLEVVTSRGTLPIQLAQGIGGLEVKHAEMLIPASSSGSGVPLYFPSGVGEAVVLYLHCDKALALELQATDGSHINLILKGDTLLTMAPGAGIQAIINIANTSTVEAKISVDYGCLISGNTADVPDFWK